MSIIVTKAKAYEIVKALCLSQKKTQSALYDFLGVEKCYLQRRGNDYLDDFELKSISAFFGLTELEFMRTEVVESVRFDKIRLFQTDFTQAEWELIKKIKKVSRNGKGNKGV